MRYIICAMYLFAGGMAGVLIGWGMDYLNPEIGYGLHPALAFSMAAFLLVLCFLHFLYVALPMEEEEQQDWDITQEIY